MEIRIPAADHIGEIFLFEFSINGESNVFFLFLKFTLGWSFRVILYWKKSCR